MSGPIVTPGRVDMAVGDSLHFRASVTVGDVERANVIWTSSDTTRVRVTSRGIAFAVRSSPGIALCARWAEANADSSLGCATVTVR
jgi:hypothetical protein